MADGFLELTADSVKTPQGIAQLNQMLRRLFELVAGDGEGTRVYYGYGSPESAVVADVGSIYLRKDGGAVTSMYVKESNSGLATGWVAK